MTIVVNSPAGMVDFPDGTSADTISHAMKDFIAKHARGNLVITGAGDFSRGLEQAMLDPIEGGLQMLGHVPGIGWAMRHVPGAGAVANWADKLRGKVEASPIASTERSIAAFANPLYYAGPGAAGALGRLAEGVIRGGAGAALQPHSEQTSAASQSGSEQDFWGAKGNQAIRGAATGGALAGVGGALGAGLSNDKMRVLAHGIRLTPGTLIPTGSSYEWLASKIPFLNLAVQYGRNISKDDFNRALYRYILTPLGTRQLPAAVGSAGLQELRDQIGTQLNRANAQLSLTPTPDLGRGLQQVAQKARVELNTRDKLQEFSNILRMQVLEPIYRTNSLTGEEFAERVTVLNNRAERFARAERAGSDPYGYTMASLLHDTANVLMTAASGPPAAVAARQAAREAYARYILVAQAASQATAEGKADPESLLRAISRRIGEQRYARDTGPLKALAEAAQRTMGSQHRPAWPSMMETVALGLGGHFAGVPAPLALMPLAGYNEPAMSGLARLAQSALRQRLGPVGRTIAGPVGAETGTEEQE